MTDSEGRSRDSDFIRKFVETGGEGKAYVDLGRHDCGVSKDEARSYSAASGANCNSASRA